MSILSSLTATLEGTSGVGLSGSPSGALVISQIISLIQSRPGGLSPLLQAFEQNGLGHLFQSWIGSGPNLPVTPDQLRGVLGTDWIGRVAQATGLPQTEIEQHLSTLLPQIVDHLSPEGRMPQGDLGSALAGLAQRFLHK